MCDNCKCGNQNCNCECNDACTPEPSDMTMVPAKEIKSQQNTIDRLQRQLNNVYENITHNIVNELNGLSEDNDLYYVQRLKRELKYNKHDTNTRYTQNIIALMTLLELMEKNIGCGYNVLNVIKDNIKDKPITPLTFEDDEFCNVPYDTELHNIRNSRVFKNIDTGRITAIGALKCNTIATVDISRKELRVDESVYANNVHYGYLFVYNEVEEKWYYVNSCHEINLKSDFIDESFEVPVVELYDSHDHYNDYYAFIADYYNIPKDFFFYFNLCPLVVKEDKDKEILKWLEEHHAEELLWQQREPIDYNVKVEYNDDSIAIHYRYSKFLKILEDCLRSNKIGFNYAKISQLFNEKDIVIILKNEPEIEEVIKLYIDPLNK